MDKEKIGALLRRLRLEQGMTQKALAERLHVSDKAISKWERSVGLPDIAMWRDLSTVLSVDVEALLRGALSEQDIDGGNMKKIQFYVCPHCGNTLHGSGGAVSCCGRSVAPLVAQSPDALHTLRVETVEYDHYITWSHPMQKTHSLSFIAWADDHRLLFVRLYAEQGGEVRIPQLPGGRLYYHCTEHGLFVQKL